ncbi:helix-turn-helix domain-containing protein [Streptomyces lasalocidi]
MTRHADDSAARQVMDAVPSDLAGDHDLHALARCANLSPRHLGRLFRGRTGVTPGQYGEAVRAEAAQALLEGDAHSVEEVARLGRVRLVGDAAPGPTSSASGSPPPPVAPPSAPPARRRGDRWTGCQPPFGRASPWS